MELEKGDLASQPVFTFIRVRHPLVESGGWRYLLLTSADREKMWLADNGTRWRSEHVKADFIELLWHPQGLHVIPVREMAEVKVLKQVANRAEKPRLVPPADYEPDNAATDGSVPMENAALRVRVKQLEVENRAQRQILFGAKVSVENMSGDQEVRRDGHLQKELRELSMLLNGGDAIRRTARAEECVEEWLKDPRRSVFGLAADLATILSPTQGAWKK
jgi:hypothetical protein